MRLIDADALKDKCYISVNGTTIGRNNYVMFHEIDNAPTIDIEEDICMGCEANDPCIYCKHDFEISLVRKEKKMTNREWLESLSYEELAKFYTTQRTICEMCDYTDVCVDEITSEKCSDGVVRWLNAEHKEPKKELTAAQLCSVFKKDFQNRRVISLEEAEKIIKGVFEDE